MVYIVSDGALNSTHSLTRQLFSDFVRSCIYSISRRTIMSSRVLSAVVGSRRGDVDDGMRRRAACNSEAVRNDLMKRGNTRRPDTDRASSLLNV